MLPAQEPTPSPGFRVGPVTWVPGLRATENDPWAHRKGEPRPLALFWSVFLMVSALVTLLRVRSLTMPTVQQFGEGCRGMLMMTMVGSALLWPMVRLSQERPGRINRSLVGDLVVILVPMQAVIWPMPVLTRWPWEVISGLAGCAAAWVLLGAGVLACGYRFGGGWSRWGTMAFLAAGVTAGPAVRVFIGPGAEAGIDVAGVLSPLTAAWALSASPDGLAPMMQWAEWVLAVAPGAVGAALWLISGRLAPAGEAGYSSPRTKTVE